MVAYVRRPLKHSENNSKQFGLRMHLLFRSDHHLPCIVLATLKDRRVQDYSAKRWETIWQPVHAELRKDPFYRVMQGLPLIAVLRLSQSDRAVWRVLSCDSLVSTSAKNSNLCCTSSSCFLSTITSSVIAQVSLVHISRNSTVVGRLSYCVGTTFFITR